MEAVVFRVLLSQEFIELLVASNQFANLDFISSTDLFYFGLRFVLGLGSLDLILIFLILKTESLNFVLEFSDAVCVFDNNLSGLARSVSSCLKFNLELSVVVLKYCNLFSEEIEFF